MLTATATIDFELRDLWVCGIGAPGQEHVLAAATADSGAVLSLWGAQVTSDDRGVFCWKGRVPATAETADGETIAAGPGVYRATAAVGGVEVAVGEFTIPQGTYEPGGDYISRVVERPRGIDHVAYLALNGFSSRLIGDPMGVVAQLFPPEGWATLGSEVWVETGPTVSDAQGIEYVAWSRPEPAFGRYYESWGFDAEWDYRQIIDAALGGSGPQMSRTMTLLQDALPRSSVPVVQSWVISNWEPGEESGTYYLPRTGEFFTVTIQHVDAPFAFNSTYLEGFEPIDDGWTQRVDVSGDPDSLFRIAQLSPDGTLLVDLWLQSEAPTMEDGEPPPFVSYDRASAVELIDAARHRIELIRSGEVTEPDGPLNEREWLLLDAYDRMNVDASLGEPSHGGTDAVRGFLWRDGTGVYVYADAPDKVALLVHERDPRASFVIGSTLVQVSGAADDPVYTWYCGFSGFEATGSGGAMPTAALDELVTELCG